MFKMELLFWHFKLKCTIFVSVSIYNEITFKFIVI
jgi:hypothetical protein